MTKHVRSLLTAAITLALLMSTILSVVAVGMDRDSDPSAEAAYALQLAEMGYSEAQIQSILAWTEEPTLVDSVLIPSMLPLDPQEGDFYTETRSLPTGAAVQITYYYGPDNHGSVGWTVGPITTVHA
jgi:hypothetical protein